MNNVSKLEKLKKSSFGVKDAKRIGVSPRMLNYYVNKGLLTHISQGVYGFPDSLGIDLNSLIREKLLAYPKGIIGLKTALRLFDLTEEAPQSIDVIVPVSYFPRRKVEDVNLYRVKDKIFRIGVISKHEILMTSLERTIIDLLRVEEPVSLVIDVIKRAQTKRIKVDFTLLKKLSIIFRVKGKMTRLMEAIL